MTIRTVLFDLDGTLKINVPSGMEMFLEYARRLGLKVDEAAALEGARWNHWYWAQSTDLTADLAQGDEENFWVQYATRLLEAVGVSAVDDSRALELTQQFADYAPQAQLNDGALETLQGLQAAGFTLGVVSNRSRPLDQILTDLGLSDYLPFRLAAGEVGIWKPDPGIFGIALKRCGCHPEDCIYVGDNYYADVVSAEAAGLTPVLLDPQRIFGDVDCRVIQRLDELLTWLL